METPRFPSVLPEKVIISDLEKKLQPKLNPGLTGEKPLRQFGYEQLRADRFQFDPIANQSLPLSYFLGPGDEVLIHDSLGKESGLLSANGQGLQVDPSGLLHIPGVRPIQAWNLTLEQLNEELREKTKFLYATLGRLRSIQVNVVGEAKRPGLHRVPAIASVYNVLALVGGVKKSGSLRRIQWKRGGEKVAEVDLYDYFLAGNSLSEVSLKSGDTLFIPLLKNAVSVSGMVRRPAIYELDGNTSVEEGIALAGGTLPDSDPGLVQIERSIPGTGRSLIRVSLDETSSRSLLLRDHDVLKVFPPVEDKMVIVNGSVIRKPGNYPLLDQMQMSDLILAAGGLDHPEATDLTAYISRWEYRNGESLRQIYRIKLDPHKLTTQPEFNLRHGDSVLIRHLAGYREPGYVTINGEVRFPGTYEFIQGERLSDVLKKAGGFTKKAFLEAAVFTRRMLRSREVAIDTRLRKDIDHALLQSTVAAASSLTSPDTQLKAINAIRQGLNEAQADKSVKIQDINLGRLVLKLKTLADFVGTADDVELMDGDVLTIPPVTRIVMVKGETLGEASLPLVEGKTATFYIDQLGGLRNSTNADDVYVIQASGLVVRDSGYEISAGDTIVAPPDLRPKESAIKEYATVVDIIFKTFTTVAILYSIGILTP